MNDLLARLLVTIAKKLLTDPIVVQQVAAFLHLSTSTMLARKREAMLAYIDANVDETVASLRGRLEEHTDGLAQTIGSFEQIKALAAEYPLGREASDLLSTLQADLHRRGAKLNLADLRAHHLEDLDLAPLYRVRDSLSDIQQRLDTPNSINPLSQQLDWLSSDLERVPEQLVTALSSVAGPPDEIWFASAAPRVVAPGDEFVVCFGAYPKSLEKDVVESLQRRTDRHANPQANALRASLKIGTEVDIDVRANEDLAIAEPHRKFLWDGKWRREDFSVSVKKGAQARPLTLTFRASVGGLPIGFVIFQLKVGRRASTTRGVSKQQIFQSAFVSYAREDWPEVQRDIRAVENINRGSIRFWIDQKDFVSGEHWKPRLKQEVRRHDLFVLFWSEFANQSDYVHWEIDQALKCKTDNQIRIAPLEHWQPDSEIPLKLRHLHFGHWTMLLTPTSMSRPASPRGDA